MPLLPKQGYSAAIGDAPIFAGRRATAQDFGAPGLGETGLVEAGHKVTSVAKAELTELEENEARKALVQSTEVRAEYARKLDEAALSGADLGKLKEEMATSLAKVGEQFQTRKGAEQLQLYAANSAIMYDQQANTINVQRARTDARIEAHKFVNGASALIQSNPLYLQEAERNADALASTFTKVPSNVRAEIADGLRKDLNMAAAISSARINPEATLKALEEGKWDLSPEQRSTAIDKSHAEIRAARAETAYVRAEEARVKQEKNDKARDQVFATVMNGTFSRRAVMDNPDLTPATREHLVMLAEARAKAAAGQERQSDPATKRDLFMAATAPEGDPRRVYNADTIFKAVEAGKLNPTDANWLNGIVAQQRDENGRGFGQRLNQRMLVLGRALNDSPEYKNQPDLSIGIQNTLISDVEKKASQMRKEGKSPDGLLDEDSKDYYFKPGVLKDAAAKVKKQALDMAKAGAVQVNSVADMLTQPDGTSLIDGTGKITTMTPALRKKLGGSAAPALERGSTVTGTIK